MKALVGVPRGRLFDTFFPEENIRLAENLGQIVWTDSTRHLTEDELAARIGDCDVYISVWGSPGLSDKVLAQAPNLKLAVGLGSSVARLICDGMWERGIRVTSGYRYYSESTAEGAIAYMLAALRRIPYYNTQLQKERIWYGADTGNDGLLYKTVGVVSYGGVGRNLVKMLSRFPVTLKVYDIQPLPKEDKTAYGFEQVGLEELFSTCDVISLHTPYNPATHHLINGQLMARMKPGALLVNTARGAILDQAALTALLQQGRIRAALDVYEREPLAADDPLMELDNAFLMPHHGGVTVNLRRVLAAELLRESADFIDRGVPLFNEIPYELAKNMTRD